jgi:putative acetyltransferase
MKLENITYRRAQSSDSEAIKNILKATFDEYGINLPNNYSFADIENLEEKYLNSAGEFIVLTREHNIIGFCALLPSGDNQVELKRLYLVAGERGKGLGKYLLNLALQIAKKSGYGRIHLETTSKFLEALMLYEKYGFINNSGATLASGHDTGLCKDL